MNRTQRKRAKMARRRHPTYEWKQVMGETVIIGGTEDIYRMIGVCVNCGAKPILMLFRAGDPSADQDCPVCGGYHKVTAQRLATADELPSPPLQ